MSTWHSKNIGDGVQAFDPSQKLHEAFLALARSGDLPPGIGVFSRYDLRTNVVTWYFSPEATALAAKFDATLCEKPVPTRGFGLLAGDSQSWKVHFPDYLASRHGSES